MPPAIKVALEARVLRNKGRRYYCDESPSLPTSLRARTTPHALTVRPPVVRVLGSSKAGLPTCGWSMRRNFLIGSKLPVPALRRAASGKSLSVMRPTLCYATHSRSLIVHAENALGTRAISDHASRMSQVIPTPASLRVASSCGCNKLASRPSPGSEGAKHPRWFAPRFNSPRKPPRTSDAYRPAAFVRLIVNRSRLR
jgi:hypothetical protein